MSHPIFMNWSNQTSDTFNYTNAHAQDGTQPSAAPVPMGPNGASSVTADQSRNLSAGPAGSYTWQNAVDANASVATQYKHPAGTGESSVTVSCSARYQVSSDNKTWYQTHTFNDKSLQQHDATITLYIKIA